MAPAHRWRIYVPTQVRSTREAISYIAEAKERFLHDERTLQILPPHEHEDYIRTFRKLVDIQCRLERHLHEFYLVYDQPLLDDILRIVTNVERQERILSSTSNGISNAFMNLADVKQCLKVLEHAEKLHHAVLEWAASEEGVRHREVVNRAHTDMMESFKAWIYQVPLPLSLPSREPRYLPEASYTYPDSSDSSTLCEDPYEDPSTDVYDLHERVAAFVDNHCSPDTRPKRARSPPPLCSEHVFEDHLHKRRRKSLDSDQTLFELNTLTEEEEEVLKGPGSSTGSEDTLVEVDESVDSEKTLVNARTSPRIRERKGHSVPDAEFGDEHSCAMDLAERVTEALRCVPVEPWDSGSDCPWPSSFVPLSDLSSESSDEESLDDESDSMELELSRCTDDPCTSVALPSIFNEQLSRRSSPFRGEPFRVGRSPHTPKEISVSEKSASSSEEEEPRHIEKPPLWRRILTDWLGIFRT